MCEFHFSNLHRRLSHSIAIDIVKECKGPSCPRTQENKGIELLTLRGKILIKSLKAKTGHNAGSLAFNRGIMIPLPKFWSVLLQFSLILKPNVVTEISPWATIFVWSNSDNELGRKEDSLAIEKKSVIHKVAKTLPWTPKERANLHKDFNCVKSKPEVWRCTKLNEGGIALRVKRNLKFEKAVISEWPKRWKNLTLVKALRTEVGEL